MKHTEVKTPRLAACHLGPAQVVQIFPWPWCWGTSLAGEGLREQVSVSELALQ